MARGIMYEITSETELENAGIFSLSEDDLLDFVGNAFDYCSDKDREEDVPEKMEYLQKFGFITGTDEIETTDGEKIVPYLSLIHIQMCIRDRDISIHDSYLTFWKIENAYGMEDPSGEYYVHYTIEIQLNGRYIEKEDMNYIFPRFN